MKNSDALVLILEDIKTGISSFCQRSINFRNRNKKWLAFLFVIAFPTLAQAQLELYSKVNSDGSIEPIIDYFGSKKINDQFALTFFGLTREKWGQALIGLLFTNRKSRI